MIERTRPYRRVFYAGYSEVGLVIAVYGYRAALSGSALQNATNGQMKSQRFANSLAK